MFLVVVVATVVLVLIVAVVVVMMLAALFVHGLCEVMLAVLFCQLFLCYDVGRLFLSTVVVLLCGPLDVLECFCVAMLAV